MGESANINPDLTTVRHEQLFIPLVLKKSTGMFLVVKLGINLFYVFIQNISVFRFEPRRLATVVNISVSMRELSRE